MSLIIDATNELNYRTKGRQARLDRLRAAGWPTEREALLRRMNAELDAQLEAAGGVYHCCTARASNGVDPDLPIRMGVGCRITRVPISARLVRVDGDGRALDEADWHWLVQWGKAGTGYLAPSTLPYSSEGDGADCFATADQAEAHARRCLLATGSCARTRAEAELLVSTMLATRLGA